ncbi:MAG: toxin-antitoxin system HicB family antitoxin [bacterium]|nr:toxin-antitoxin system HicB family antitoxin [bacterium]
MDSIAPEIQAKAAEVYRIARELQMHNPSWEVFFRQIVGMGGAIPTAFPTPEAKAAFAETDEYAEIHKMLAVLRTARGEEAERREPTRVITVRLPKSLHESLRAEAHEHQTSMNKLCISKLLQALSEEMIPSDSIFASVGSIEG